MQELTPYNFEITKNVRNKNYGHNSFLIWFTGLSGSGKSTIANALEVKLHQQEIKTFILDGDNVRKSINSDLDFSPKDRAENTRRIAEISNLFITAGVVVIGTFVSPYKKDRKSIEYIVKDSNFVEVFINTCVKECERRDVKGLYKKARTGEIKNMTGISSPYEVPENPDVEINTEKETVEEAVKKIIDFITPKLQLNNE